MRKTRDEGIEARRHEVVAKAMRDQVQRTHPHSLPPSLVPTPCLRAYVPTCLPLPPPPQVCQISKRTHRKCANSAHLPTSPAPRRTLHGKTPERTPRGTVRDNSAERTPAQTRHKPPKPATSGQRAWGRIPL